VLSTRATATPAQCAAAAPDVPRWYQVYLLQDEARSEQLVLAARDAGVRALVLTVDTPVLGRRRRDILNGFEIPADIGAASIHLEPGEPTNFVDQRASLTFDDIGKLHELAGLPVVVKGVLRADDARACLDAGAAAIWVSNHGGRQLDGAVSTAVALPEVLDEVGGAAEVYVDGGIRSGNDALKAIAVGATAVFVGRPLLWGLAVGGRDGARKVLDGLRSELSLAMALAGAPSIADVTRDLVAAERAR
jgi:4-hydroxymandelate oxidase